MNNVKAAVMRMIGTPPINPVAFAIGKLTLVVLVVVPLLQLSGVPVSRPIRGMTPVAAALATVGAVVLFAASRSLGSSLRVGLPKEETTLKTSGIYRFSRHPIYLSVFLLAIAVCLYAPHPFVIITAVVAIAIHHAIALAEESFLERRFGTAWLQHKARVPRYLGIPKGAA